MPTPLLPILDIHIHANTHTHMHVHYAQTLKIKKHVQRHIRKLCKLWICLFVDFVECFEGYFWIIFGMNTTYKIFVTSVKVLWKIKILHDERQDLESMGWFLPSRNCPLFQLILLHCWCNGRNHITNVTFGIVFCLLFKVQFY